MDIQNLLCQTTLESTKYFDHDQYDKQTFDYCPSSPSAWSSITSKTYISEPMTPSDIHTREQTNTNILLKQDTLYSNDEENDSMYSGSSTIVFTASPELKKSKKHTKNQTRTPWTSSEDYLLEKGYLQGLSWAMISAKYLPHRSRGCCWGRFKTLQTKSTERKHWSESEDRVLLGAIMKHTQLFKHAWKSVAMDLNNRDWRECEIRSARISGIMNRSRNYL